MLLVQICQRLVHVSASNLAVDVRLDESRDEALDEPTLQAHERKCVFACARFDYGRVVAHADEVRSCGSGSVKSAHGNKHSVATLLVVIPYRLGSRVCTCIRPSARGDSLPEVALEACEVHTVVQSLKPLG